MNLDLAAIGEVIRLADVCAVAESKAPQRINFEQLEAYFHSPAVQESRQCSENLEEYMQTLDYETILDIETLMQIGRDHDYRESDPYEVRFQDCRDYFSSSYPSPENKGSAIDYLSSKVDLAQYLRDGLAAVGIRL